MDTLAIAGFRSLLNQYGRTLQILDGSGTTFRAVVAVAPMVDPALELGYDPRELSIIECLNDDAPETDVSQIQFQDVVAKNKWKVVRREDNPADFTVRYWVVKIVPGKDT